VRLDIFRSMATASGKSVSSRGGGNHVETQVAGRVVGSTIREMIADYERLGGGPVWLIRAEGATAYTTEAVNEAVGGFGRLFKERNLRRIIAVIVKPTVRMGASIVAMSLRAAGSPVDIHVVGDAAAATTALEARV